MDINTEFKAFMEKIEKRMEEIGLPLTKYPIDHICYRVTTLEEFKEMQDYLAERSSLYSEKYLNDRTFNIFVLKDPLEYNGIKVTFIEISEPGGSDIYERGFQHIEILTNDSWDETGVDPAHMQEFLAISKYGNGIYMKWADKVVVKVTDRPVIVSALTEDSPKIHVMSEVA